MQIRSKCIAAAATLAAQLQYVTTVYTYVLGARLDDVQKLVKEYAKVNLKPNMHNDHTCIMTIHA